MKYDIHFENFKCQGLHVICHMSTVFFFYKMDELGLLSMKPTPSDFIIRSMITGPNSWYIRLLALFKGLYKILLRLPRPIIRRPGQSQGLLYKQFCD